MSNYKTPPAYLRRALDSMLGQTMPDFEAVVINDGVKDESYEILLEYAAKDQRIRLIENEKNLGLPASLNRGIEQCRGKYIARMDTDDICYPDRLEKQVEYMERNPEVMFAGAWADIFEENENKIVKTWKPSMPSKEEYRIRLLFANDPLLIHPTVVFRSSFLFENELRYSEQPIFRFSEDYEMWTRCIEYGNAGILEQTVLKYRMSQSENRITVRYEQEMKRCIDNVQKGLLKRLGISEYDPELHYRLLSGRKTYDLKYKTWMETIRRRNDKAAIYDSRELKRLFHERWYHIVYYAIAYEKNPFKKTKYFLSLYPDGYLCLMNAFFTRKGRKNK
ncbi:MAG: glycosyltransferase [Clostridia bacterium]|nr:glycosyltransferase [Clostridia bacterium]